jgi:chemotaxis protein CheC
MGLTGRLSGQLLLVFADTAGLALADLLLNQPIGTTTAWGALEQSAAQETTNIVGCAYLNALAAHLPLDRAADVVNPATTEEGGQVDSLAETEPEAGAGLDSHGPESTTDLVPTPPTFVHEFAGSLLEFALMDQAAALDQVLLIQTQFAAEPPSGGLDTAVDLNWTLLFVPSESSLRVLMSGLTDQAP